MDLSDKKKRLCIIHINVALQEAGAVGLEIWLCSEPALKF